jgi:hypothetical protein
MVDSPLVRCPKRALIGQSGVPFRLKPRLSARTSLKACHLLPTTAADSMNEKRVIICPKCGQAYPWSVLPCIALDQLEDWTDYVSYSPKWRSSVGRLDRPNGLDFFIPTLRTCTRCESVFEINPTAACTSQQAEATEVAGSAGSREYLRFLKTSENLPETKYVNIVLEAWARSNDRLRQAQHAELQDLYRNQILAVLIDGLQSSVGPYRVRAAEAARQSGNFSLAISLLNQEFEPSIRPYADFVRDLAQLGDVLVRKIAVYPEITAFEKAKVRAAEYAAELVRAQAEWEKKKKAISQEHSSVGGMGCLLLLAGVLGAGFLGQLAIWLILLGIVVFLVFLPLSNKSDRQAKAWEEKTPKPAWKVVTPTFNAVPPIISAESLPNSANQSTQAQVSEELDEYAQLGLAAANRVPLVAQKLGFSVGLKDFSGEKSKHIVLLSMLFELLLFERELNDSHSILAPDVKARFHKSFARFIFQELGFQETKLPELPESFYGALKSYEGLPFYDPVPGLGGSATVLGKLLAAVIQEANLDATPSTGVETPAEILVRHAQIEQTRGIYRPFLERHIIYGKN